jgi:hypothetical protein
MKMLMTAVALTALITSPAFAVTSKDLLKEVAAQSPQQADVINAPPVATSAYAADTTDARFAAPHNVYVDGQIIGADPDPLVREQMQKEFRADW